MTHDQQAVAAVAAAVGTAAAAVGTAGGGGGGAEGAAGAVRSSAVPHACDNSSSSSSSSRRRCRRMAAPGSPEYHATTYRLGRVLSANTLSSLAAHPVEWWDWRDRVEGRAQPSEERQVPEVGHAPPTLSGRQAGPTGMPLDTSRRLSKCPYSGGAAAAEGGGGGGRVTAAALCDSAMALAPSGSARATSSTGDCPFGYGSLEQQHGAAAARSAMAGVAPPAVGQPVRKLGVEFRWSELHQTPAQLDAWRFVGDPLIDELLHLMPLKTDDDALQLLRAHAAADAVPGTRSELTAAATSALRQLETVPAWVDWPAVRRAQDLFMSNVAACHLVLVNSSLAGGYGSPNVNKVLGSTGYLAGEDLWRRIMETGLMVAQCMMPDQLLANGHGWEVCVRVRFLHARVRRRLCRLADWKTDAWGVPINQEDMVATQLVFSLNLMRGLADIGFRFADGQVDDMLHLWRLVGFYMGIDERINPCYDFHVSTAMLQSIFLHQVAPDSSSAVMAQSLLRTAAAYSPHLASYQMNVELTRVFMGNAMGDQLQLPPSSTPHRLLLKCLFFLLRVSGTIVQLPGVRSMYLPFVRAMSSRVLKAASDNHAFVVRADPTSVVLSVPQREFVFTGKPGTRLDAHLRIVAWIVRARLTLSAGLVMWLVWRMLKVARRLV